MSGINAHGTALQRGDGDPGGTGEVFAAIANVTNIGGPGLERGTIDTTAHDTVNKWRTFIGGLKDGGEIELDVNYDPSKHDVLVEDFETDEPMNYKLVFPDAAGTTWAIQALLTGFEPEAPIDDKLAAALTFKVSGKPDLSGGGV